MKWQQLDLLGLLSRQPEATTLVAKTTAHTITHTPSQGYKVVMACGLTTKALRNPCRTCDDFGRDMDACAVNCKYESARIAYLQQIGVPDVSAVSTVDGAYGVGC